MEIQEKPDYAGVLIPPFLFVLLLWVVAYLEWKLNLDWVHYSLYPKTLEGSRGILFAPLLHAGFYHLISNTVPLLILGAFMLHFYRSISYAVFFIVYFGAEIGAWFFARPSYHLGASGIVYGLVTFLFLSGIIRRNIQLTAVSLLVTFLYGGLLWGVLPLPTGMSWETHLSGAITGVLCAVVFRKKGPQRNVYEFEKDTELDNEPGMLVDGVDLKEDEIDTKDERLNNQTITYVYVPKEEKP